MQPLFLIVNRVKHDHVRARLLLRAVHAGLEGAGTVDLHYQPDRDRALLTVNLVHGLTSPRQLAWVREALVNADIEVLEPGRVPNDLGWGEGIAIVAMPSPDVALRALARRIGLDTSPPDLGSATDAHERLRVRCWRGREWRAGRICSLSEQGVFIATGVAPRRGERIEIELALLPTDGGGGAACIVQLAAVVADVIPTDATAALGAAGFVARFVDVDKLTGAALETICAAVRGVVTLPQPPRRVAARIPVRWPVRLAVDGVLVDAIARDISPTGMFVATTAQIHAHTVDMAVPLDDGEVMVQAEVTRAITPAMAKLRALPIGYGVRVTALAEGDAERYARFVARVTRRAHAHVVVAATGNRRDEIFRELSSLGYAPHVVDEPAEMLMARPELVIVDGSPLWTEVATSLRAQHIPLVDIAGRPAADARIVADSLIASAY